MNLFHPDTLTVLFILASVVIPFISRALTSVHLDTFWVGVVSAVLATANGFIATWQAAPDASHYNWQLAASASVLSFLVAVVGGQHGLLKATHLEQRLAVWPNKLTP